MERLVSGQWGRAPLLEYVFLEVVTVLLVRQDLSTAVAAGSTLLQASEVDFLSCSDFFFDTVETFRTQQGRANLSFTDAATVTAARRHAPGYVATFDADFRELHGVTVVPRALDLPGTTCPPLPLSIPRRSLAAHKPLACLRQPDNERKATTSGSPAPRLRSLASPQGW